MLGARALGAAGGADEHDEGETTLRVDVKVLNQGVVSVDVRRSTLIGAIKQTLADSHFVRVSPPQPGQSPSAQAGSNGVG
jgi:hypothetical protein